MDTIKINGVDCTHLFKDRGYVVSEKKITGSNTSVTLGGRTREDLIRLVDVVKLPLEPISKGDLVTLMQLLRQSQYVTLEYFSPNYGVTRTAEFIREPATNTHMFTCSLGNDYYEGSFIQLEEV